MLNTHITIKKNKVRKLGNKSIVEYTIWGGYYEIIEDVEQFVYSEKLFNGEIIFNYYPTPAQDITDILNKRINDYIIDNNIDLVKL